MRIPTTFKTDLISVIVPVFYEKKLCKCLDSIINQTYKNIEIICVNDASPNNTLAILNEYAQKDSRIIIVENKINNGTSISRKIGLDHSNGKYIIFLDDDDFIEPDMLKTMLNVAILQDLDMVCCGIFIDFEKDGKTVTQEAPHFPQNKIERILSTMVGRDLASACAVWNKLVKREVYENVIFPKEVPGEDDFVTAQTLYYSEKIGQVEQYFYHWCIREDSQSVEKKNKEKLMQNYLSRKVNYTNLLKFLKEKFGDDLNVFEPKLSIKRCSIESAYNPNKSIIVQELEALDNFMKQSPIEAIKEAEKYISERIKLNVEKIKGTDEIYLLTCCMILQNQMNTFLQTPLISVIIPVYNVENYLRQCLDSICNQTYKNIEIVCVNDASPDNSLAILNEYAAKDNRVKVIDKKENEGSSLARKAGINNSNGNYIICIDSDDWLELNMFEKMVNAAIFYGLDMVCCGHFDEFENGGIRINNAPIFPVSKVERIKYFSLGWNVAAVTVVNKLIKREIYQKVCFPEESFGEDHFITCQTLYYSEKIGNVPDSFYHYRIRKNSLCNRENTKSPKWERNYLEMKKNYERVIMFCTEKFNNHDLNILKQNFAQKRIEIENLNPKLRLK